MTKAQYTKLNKYASYLYSASKADFIRGLSNREVEELIGIGAELGILYKNNHCPKCLLDFIKKLAIPYYEYENKSKTTEKKEEKPCSKTKKKITKE